MRHSCCLFAREEWRGSRVLKEREWTSSKPQWNYCEPEYNQILGKCNAWLQLYNQYSYNSEKSFYWSLKMQRHLWDWRTSYPLLCWRTRSLGMLWRDDLLPLWHFTMKGGDGTQLTLWRKLRNQETHYCREHKLDTFIMQLSDLKFKCGLSW